MTVQKGIIGYEDFDRRMRCLALGKTREAFCLSSIFIGMFLNV